MWRLLYAKMIGLSPNSLSSSGVDWCLLYRPTAIARKIVAEYRHWTTIPISEPLYGIPSLWWANLSAACDYPKSLQISDLGSVVCTGVFDRMLGDKLVPERSPAYQTFLVRLSTAIADLHAIDGKPFYYDFLFLNVSVCLFLDRFMQLTRDQPFPAEMRFYERILEHSERYLRFDDAALYYCAKEGSISDVDVNTWVPYVCLLLLCILIAFLNRQSTWRRLVRCFPPPAPLATYGLQKDNEIYKVVKLDPLTGELTDVRVIELSDIYESRQCEQRTSQHIMLVIIITTRHPRPPENDHRAHQSLHVSAWPAVLRDQGAHAPVQRAHPRPD